MLCDERGETSRKETDVELLLLALKHVGFRLRKDDPALIARHGLAAVAEWRRGFDSVPPLADADCASVRHGIRGESVRMCGDRVVACWTERVAPLVRQRANVLVVAHGNSLRGIVKHIDGISDDEITSLEVPLQPLCGRTGAPPR